jgi:pectinesterase
MIKLKVILSCSMLLIGVFAFGQTLEQKLTTHIDIVVDKAGKGDHATVQAAINAVPNNSPNRTVVFIRKGVYKEKVRIAASKINLVLIGEDLDSTIITFDDYASISGFDCTTVKVDADDFLAMNITFENSFDNTPTSSQALAMATYGDRQSFVHCRFNGYQDTYFSGSNKRAYFKDCLIIGAVDFIYGPSTVIFDSCQIHNVRSGGYITAASTPQETKFGYVFRHCRITADLGIENVWFARPWRAYSSTTFYECYEASCINPLGWHNWGNVSNESTARYAEYKCVGPGTDNISKRVGWSKQLTTEEASVYTTANIYAASSNPYVTTDWMPSIEKDELYMILLTNIHPILYADYLDAELINLKIDGTDMLGFHQDSTFMVVELPTGTTVVPTLEAVTASDITKVAIQYPESVPGFAKINVDAPYMADQSKYSVYFSVDNAYHSADAAEILLNEVSVPNFKANDTTYLIGVAEGTTRFMPTDIVPKAAGATIKKSYPYKLPGQYKFTIVAVDGVTTKTYYVDVVFGEVLAVSDLETNENIDFHFENPTTDSLHGSLGASKSGDYEWILYDQLGRKVKQHSFRVEALQKQVFKIDISTLPQGLYIYKISGAAGRSGGRIVKF